MPIGRTLGTTALSARALLFIASIVIVAACHDTLTGPNEPAAQLSMPSRSASSFSSDSDFGALNSPNAGSWENDSPSIWDGSTPREYIGTFNFPTIITVLTSGTICQYKIWIDANGCWGPAGTPDHQAAIGLLVDHPGSGSGVWLTTGTEPQTFAIAGIASAFRAGLNDPQPWGEYYWACGRYVQVPCWGFQGPSRLSFTRLAASMLLASSASAPVPRGTMVNFVASVDTAGLGGRSVNVSLLRWRWVPTGEVTNSADSITCEAASGMSCTHRVAGSGTMFVTAYVNGEQQERSAPVSLDAPPDSANKLRLTGQPKRLPANGGSVDFTAYPQQPTDNWGVTGWLFLPDSGASRASGNCERTSDLPTCRDSIGQTGTMRVYGWVPGISNDSADFRVYLGDAGLLRVSGPGTYPESDSTVTFTASAPSAQSFDIKSWSFRADGASASRELDCGQKTVCQLAPPGPGYVIAEGNVDGGIQRDSTHTAPDYVRMRLTASPSSVVRGGDVSFTASAEKLPATVIARSWQFLPDSSAAQAVNGCADHLVCPATVMSSGTMWVRGSVNGHSDSASARITVRSPSDTSGAGADSSKPITLSISATFPLPDSSFTTIPGENVVRLHAEVSDPSRVGEVRWELKDDPNDQVTSVVAVGEFTGRDPIVTMNNWQTPSDEGTPRWQIFRSCPAGLTKTACDAAHNPGTLDQKAIGYVVQAYVMDHGNRVSSKPITITQSAIDALRQEYVDFAKPVIPSRTVLVTSRGTAHFSLAELSRNSDYRAIPPSPVWITNALADSLERMREVYGSALPIMAGYRNPVHNWVHVGIDQGYGASKTSHHQYGGAADIASHNSSDEFYEMSRAGAKLGACMEPPAEFFTPAEREGKTGLVHNFDHVHVDWTPGYPCNPDWVRFRESLLTP